jgi:hypothetical protein
MTGSSPNSAPVAAMNRFELVVEVKGDPIIKAKNKEVTYVLVWEQVSPNIYRDWAVPNHMKSCFFKLGATMAIRISNIPTSKPRICEKSIMSQLPNKDSNPLYHIKLPDLTPFLIHTIH